MEVLSALTGGRLAAAVRSSAGGQCECSEAEAGQAQGLAAGDARDGAPGGEVESGVHGGFLSGVRDSVVGRGRDWRISP